MEYTENLQLGKPHEEEYYDVNVTNHNMDIIDRTMGDRIKEERLTKTALYSHVENLDNPHHVTKAQVGLEHVDNTSDMDKPVSRVQQDALDAQYRQLTAYTDEGIADLIDGAPQTLDTLREIAEAMTDNKDVVEALQEAVGSKASKAEFDSHESNYNNPHRVEAEDVGLGNVPNVSTNDQTPTYTPAAAPAVLTSGEKLSAAFGKLAVAVADYITHKVDMIKRMTAVEAGVSSLNKNFDDSRLWKELIPITLGANTSTEVSVTHIIKDYTSEKVHEIMVQYGRYNQDQIYGGGTAVYTHSQNHPAMYPVYVNLTCSLIGYIYIAVVSGQVRIITKAATEGQSICYSIYYR